jgi:hypothetical protein
MKNLQSTPQRMRRKDRSSPINILYQDWRDTTKLLKTNLQDMQDFYIKRINNGKHTHTHTHIHYKSIL